MVDLTLHFWQSPGDCLASTGAIKCLHDQHPGLFRTAVIGGKYVQDIFYNNPYISEVLPGSRIIRMDNPLVMVSDLFPVTYCHSYVYTLTKELGVTIAATHKVPFIYLTEREKEEFPQKLPKRYVVINAGHKWDFTVKHYPYWQRVVEAFPEVPFVQVGEVGDNHNHPLLKGKNIIDYRGKTTTRDLMLLAYHSLCGIGPETFLTHIYAAFYKVYIAVMSGAWSSTFLPYPTVRFIQRIGMLSCCKERSCGRVRVKANDIGPQKDLHNEHLCLQPDGEFARCMTSISSTEIIENLKSFLSNQ